MNYYYHFFYFAWSFFLIYTLNTNAVNETNNESKTRDYEIVTPKRGFVGSPPSPAGEPNTWLPTKPSHFDKRYIRVTELPERVSQGMRRIVLRVDEIDEVGKILKRLYYVYIDISSEGAKILHRIRDDNSSIDDFGFRKYSMPFSFVCARSPALGFKDGEMDGYVRSSGHGVEFVRKKAKESDKSIQVEAAYFDTGEDGKTRWYGNEIDRIRKEKASVKFREKQEWANENDWLWTKMERYDANGNIMMHCRKIKIGSIDKDDDWPISFRATNAPNWFTSQGSTNNLTK
ncbi:MAG: hypothetical protein KJ687_10165 [Proteobacteria bacterium]|nr:hypothetical protein [Pseudomonadota bacterium]